MPFGLENLVTDYVGFGSLQADKIEKLEKDHSWHEEEFDFILQFLRTILLKRECLLCLKAIANGALINDRRRVPNLHDTIPGQLPSESSTFVLGDTLAPEETITQTQRDRPGQDPGAFELGLMGKDPDYPRWIRHGGNIHRVVD